MSKYEIKNTEGKKVGDADLSADVYGIEPNIPVVHQVVTCQAASLRQGTHSTKNRHEVSGGGVKPYRQKGTGRARQSSPVKLPIPSLFLLTTWSLIRLLPSRQWLF